MTDEETPDPAKKQGGFSPGAIGCLGILGAIAVIWFLSSIGLLGGDTSDTGDDSTAAREACETAVRAQLSDPATADFSIMDLSVTQNGDGGWRISSTVKAENGLGIEESLSWICITDAQSNVESAQVHGD